MKRTPVSWRFPDYSTKGKYFISPSGSIVLVQGTYTRVIARITRGGVMHTNRQGFTPVRNLVRSDLFLPLDPEFEFIRRTLSENH